MKKIVAIRVATAACAALVTPIGLTAQGHEADTRWTYAAAHGPDHWGDLSPTYQQCGTGSRQSPIDIPINVATHTADIDFHYADAPLDLINNGHTIQANYAPGSYILLDDQRYELLQFHFHSASEHTVSRTAFAMEAHFVHRSAAGQLAVVGVFLKNGKTNRFVRRLWDHLPHEAHHAAAPRDVSINGADLLPQDRSFVQYSGSLTTPPCSEDVIWNVLKTPVEVSAAQVAAFTALIPPNARPIQPRNGREFR